MGKPKEITIEGTSEQHFYILIKKELCERNIQIISTTKDVDSCKIKVTKKDYRNVEKIIKYTKMKFDYHCYLIKLLENSGIEINDTGIQVNDNDQFKICVVDDKDNYTKALKIIDDEYSKIRAQWDKEDRLLLDRTGIFLTANALLFGFSVMQKDYYALPMLLLISLSIVITFMWRHTTNVSNKIISYLFNICTLVMPKTIKKIYQNEIAPSKLRPNKMLSLLPNILLGGGFIFLTVIILLVRRNLLIF